MCTHGKQLLELCISSGLRILNGRSFGDSNGNFTCHRYNGSSVLDYVIAQECVLSSLRYFRVHEFMGNLSDHCKLSFGLKLAIDIHVQKEKLKRKAPFKYKLNEQSMNAFKYKISQQATVNEFIDISCKDANIDDQTKSIVKLIHDVAQSCFTKCNAKTRRKKKHKKWFNSSCDGMKKHVLYMAKQLNKNPGNGFLRAEFHKCK